jgi:hypothetical protein
MKKLLIAAALSFWLVPAMARADCSSPAGVEAEVIYNADYHVMQFCNGTDWVAMGGLSGGGSSGPAVPTDVKETTATHDGDFDSNGDSDGNGYEEMQAFIEANGCSGYEIFRTEDIIRYLEAGNNFSTTGGWVLGVTSRFLSGEAFRPIWGETQGGVPHRWRRIMFLNRCGMRVA